MLDVLSDNVCNQVVELFSNCNTVSTKNININFTVSRQVHLCRIQFLTHCGVVLWNNLPFYIKTTAPVYKFMLRTHIASIYSVEFIYL